MCCRDEGICSSLIDLASAHFLTLDVSAWRVLRLLRQGLSSAIIRFHLLGWDITCHVPIGSVAKLILTPDKPSSPGCFSPVVQNTQKLAKLLTQAYNPNPNANSNPNPNWSLDHAVWSDIINTFPEYPVYRALGEKTARANWWVHVDAAITYSNSQPNPAAIIS
jgi:hypothetical protein